MDLHIHTCLSPCGDFTMVPSVIVKQAIKKNLDGIGISDHNTAENVTAVKKAGEKAGIAVFGGLEITSREEVHILTLFEDDETLLKMQNIVYDHLSGENDEDFFGEQLVADENDRIYGTVTKLLLGAADLSVDEIVRIVHSLGGIAIASHIDREQFSIIGQLGFIPPSLPLDALEISPKCDSGAIDGFETFDIPFVSFSDAHYVEDVGKTSTRFYMNELSFSELRLALQGVKGRKINIR